MLFHVNIYGSFKLSKKQSGFFGPPSTSSLMTSRLAVMGATLKYGGCSMQRRPWTALQYQGGVWCLWMFVWNCDSSHRRMSRPTQSDTHYNGSTQQAVVVNGAKKPLVEMITLSFISQEWITGEITSLWHSTGEISQRFRQITAIQRLITTKQPVTIQQLSSCDPFQNFIPP